MIKKNSRIFVTGHNGLVGSAVVRRLKFFGYKNIILNPPYIRFQDLSIDYRKFIKEKWNILSKGNIDLYYAFIIKCIELLDDCGIMVAIIPNSYLYNNTRNYYYIFAK